MEHQLLFTKPTAAETAHTDTAAPDYPLFDWLRFVLASVVALGHAGVITWHQAGNLSVQVFFALSGWLIGGILLRSDSSRLPRFFFNRATRIWAPYAFAVAVLYVVSALRQPITERWGYFLLYDLTFTHNWFSFPIDAQPLKGTGNHFWSIAIEEQFYLVAPLLILFVPLGRSPAFWCTISTMLLVAQVPDFASISLGAFAASLQMRHRDWHMSWTPAIAVVAALSAGALTLIPYALAAPLFAISVVLLCARAGQRTDLGKFFGGISYPMYLNHWIGAFLVHGIAKHAGLPVHHVLVGLTAYALGTLAGAAAYLLIDRNVLRWRNKWYTHLRGSLLGATAYLLVIAGIAVGITALR